MRQDLEYKILNDSTFEKEVLRYHKLVIVEFGVEWCGSCRIMAQIVNDIAAAYQDQLRVVRLDIDQNQRLAVQYGIQAKPTYLLINNGEIVDYIVGSASRKFFEDKVISVLASE